MAFACEKNYGYLSFSNLYKAMDAAQHLVALDPVAVELIDDTMLELARSIPLFQTYCGRGSEG